MEIKPYPRAIIAVIVFAILSLHVEGLELNQGKKGNYAFVNGLKMYYEIHGDGPPVVLLHGGLMTIESSFGKLMPLLMKTRKVISMEQQGHGHTADIDRPFSYEQMADDTAALLKQINIKEADFIGFSDGGIVTLGIAIRHPDVVRKMAVLGTNFSNEGLYPEILGFFKNAKVEDVEGLKDAYIRVAPKPEDWPTVVSKAFQMTLNFNGWKRDDLRSIKSPALIIIGDDDIVRPEHAIELFRLMPNSRLSVLPNTKHEQLIERTDWLYSMISEFLGH